RRLKMALNNEMQKKIDELSKYITKAILQTIVNIILIIICYIFPYQLLILVVGALSAGTAGAWALCIIEFLDLKKMAKMLNK
ncbi:hypothetical protein, partial [Melissococcus plutonius]